MILMLRQVETKESEKKMGSSKRHLPNGSDKTSCKRPI